MLAQRAERGCGNSVGVQEFWGSFVPIAVSFVVLVVKIGRWAWMFFTTEITMSAQRAQRGDRNGQVRKGKERKAEGSRLRVVPSFCGIRLDIL